MQRHASSLRPRTLVFAALAITVATIAALKPVTRAVVVPSSEPAATAMPIAHAPAAPVEIKNRAGLEALLRSQGIQTPVVAVPESAAR